VDRGFQINILFLRCSKHKSLRDIYSIGKMTVDREIQDCYKPLVDYITDIGLIL